MSARAEANRLTAVAAANGRAIAVGPDGHILVSGDNGKTWHQAAVPVSSDLVAVRFLNEDKAWAVGHDGMVLHSADGGKTWTKQLDGIQAAKLMHDYYASRDVEGSPDAGRLMADVERFVEEGADKPFFDVLFLNENEGFVVGAFNIAFYTRDGGKSWVPLFDRTENPGGFHLYGLATVSDTVYLVGERGLIRRWDPESERFVVVDSPYAGSFFGAIGNDSLLVLFGMRGNAFASRNGGLNWTTLETETTAGITSGAVLPDGRIVMTTYSGALLVSDDAMERFTRVQASNPMAYAGVATAGEGGVVLVGNSGVRVESIKPTKNRE
jgi:photosystem II stability/assembly factor-like uncharacterized protein